MGALYASRIFVILWMLWIVVLALIPSAGAMSIVEVYPGADEDSILLEGDSVTLYCEADLEWQWCYFEHADSGRRESTYKHNDDDGDRFEESEFGCSFLIDNVTRDDGGEWKCQLADTDASVVKAEAFIDLAVAFEAEVQVEVALEDEFFLGDNITVSCQMTDSNAFPVPTLTLLVWDSDVGLVISEEEETHSLSVDIALEREDNGASYLCRSEQILQSGNETIQFTSESAPSGTVNLIYPPIFDDDDDNAAAPIVVLEESEEPVNVVLSFHASPRPDNESVTWIVGGDEILSLMAGDETHGFVAYPVLPGGSGKDSYVSILQASNVTANTTVTAIVDNGVGQTNRTFVIVYVPEEAVILVPPPSRATEDEMSEAGIAGWLVALIAVACVIFILALMFSVCAAKAYCDKHNPKEESSTAAAAAAFDPEGDRRKNANAAKRLMREQEMKIFAQTTPQLQPRSPQRSPIKPTPVLQSFKPDDVDSGLGKSDDNATVAAVNVSRSEDKEEEMAKGEGKGANLPEEEEERSKLLSPELVMNQTIMLDSESPALARASTVPKSPRSPAQFHLPESRQLRGKQSLPAAMAADGYYDQESGSWLRFSGPTNYPVMSTFRDNNGGNGSAATSNASTPFGNRKQLSFMKPDKL